MIENVPFIHLHNHTEYSLLDGATKIKKMVDKAIEMGQSAVAVTDHGVMHATIPFYNYAKKMGVKPIVGCEVYLAARSMHQKEGKIDAKSMHLVLLAKNEKGYVNLMKLCSLGHTDGYYYKPRVDYEAIEKYKDGLICLTACMAGPIAVKILDKNYEAALAETKKLYDMFGEDLYLEIQDHGIEGQKEIVQGIININKELNIPIVATNDIHYLNKEDASAQDVLLCISTGKKLADENRMSFGTDEFYMKSGKEMLDLFSYVPEAISNTLLVAEKCNLEIEQGVNYLPEFPIPDGFNKESWLEKITWHGIKDRYSEITQEIKDRVAFELDIINKMEFPAYFLIVADLIQYARNKGIAVGPGRGSAAGSIVAYSLGITNIDPIKFNLLFERFLNPERVSMPDIDIDFCIERRQEVIDYVREKYGSDKVAQIVTFGTLAAKGVIRDVGRVMDIPLAEVDRIAKMVPDGPKITLNKAMVENPEMKAYYDNNKTVNDLINTCFTLEGVSRNTGTHAAGVIISRFPLTDRVPVIVSDGQLVTQYPKDEVEMVGLLKMDFLGLRNLTMIENSLRIIERTHGVSVDLENIDMADSATYELLCRADTTGVFQLESQGMKKLLKNLQPSVFEDVIALLALYRPGPLGCGMDKDFVNRKHGREDVSYMLPKLEPILKDTYGTILYQEQIMKIASDVAGFSLGQADVLRRAMGKKKTDVMEQQREFFVEGSRSVSDVDEKISNKLFDMLMKFAEYGFNKSHSAAYAVITYQTAWLKAHYPLEFMAALITSMMGTIEKVSFYVTECRNMDIDIKTPDVNESFREFSVVNDTIRFGLGAIRNVGDIAIESIVNEREKNGIYHSLYEFCSRVELRTVNKRVIESLIKAGAMDVFGKRKQMIEVLDQYVQSVAREQKAKESGMVSLFAAIEEESDKAKSDNFPDIADFSDQEKLKMEKEMLGLYISDHPLNHIGINLSVIDHDTTDSIKELEDKESIKMIGMISSARKVITRNQKNMIIAEFEDLLGSCELLLFPFRYEANADKIFEDALVIIEGKVNKSDGMVKIVCDTATPLNVAQNMEKVLNIEIEGVDDRDTLLTIKDILLSNRGGVKVVFHTRNKKIMAGDGYRVKPNKDMSVMIEKLVGAKRVYETNVSLG